MQHQKRMTQKHVSRFSYKSEEIWPRATEETSRKLNKYHKVKKNKTGTTKKEKQPPALKKEAAKLKVKFAEESLTDKMLQENIW